MEFFNLYFLIDVELNNVLIDVIFDIDEISIILSDEIFKMLLNKGYCFSISNYEIM